MHVKRLTTSQAFLIIPRKAIVYQDVKALQVSLCKEQRQAVAKCHNLHYLRSQDSNLHIPQIYCNTLLSTNSTHSFLTERLVLAGLTRTPTEQNITTMGILIIAMCFVDGVLWRWTTGGLQHTILYSLASVDNPRCTVTKYSFLQTTISLIGSWVSSLSPAAAAFCVFAFFLFFIPQIGTNVDTPPPSGAMECVLFLLGCFSFPFFHNLGLSPSRPTAHTVINILLTWTKFWGLTEGVGESLSFCNAQIQHLTKKGSSLFTRQYQTWAAIIFITSLVRVAPKVLPSSSPSDPLPLSDPSNTTTGLLFV